MSAEPLPTVLVVAVALSAQATDVSVNKATERLFKVADTPEKMLALGEEGLIPYIASIGLYRTKAKNVIAAARMLVDKHGGEVYVYRRAGQPCLVCGTPVALEEFAGRNLFWCGRCQRR